MHPLWTQLAAAAGITLDDDQQSRLQRYLDLLLEANARMNLTRIDDPAEAQVQHVGDALTLLPFLPRGAFALADVGSGGGVPGFPLAIARPEASVTLIESTRKKADFLLATAAALGLGNMRVLPQRAEEVARSPLRQSFDVAVARAVAPMDILAEWCLPLVRKGGKLLAMKGPKVREELPAARKAIDLLGGGEPTIHPVSLPNIDRHLIVQVPKVGSSDARHPRPASVARRRPLP